MIDVVSLRVRRERQSAHFSFTPGLQPGDLGPIKNANRINGFLRCDALLREH